MEQSHRARCCLTSPLERGRHGTVWASLTVWGAVGRWDSVVDPAGHAMPSELVGPSSFMMANPHEQHHVFANAFVEAVSGRPIFLASPGRWTRHWRDQARTTHPTRRKHVEQSNLSESYRIPSTCNHSPPNRPPKPFRQLPLTCNCLHLCVHARLLVPPEILVPPTRRVEP